MFRCIVADPPWNERGGGRVKRGADRHYPLLSRSAIVSTIRGVFAALQPAADAHLWLWATSNHLPDALWIIPQLGFRYTTDFVWLKDRIGLGQYRRSRHELLLLATRGQATLPATPWPSSIIEAPRTRHSTKPVETYDMIEAVSPGPRLELFAREQRPGWVVWGNEIPGYEATATAK